MEQPINNKLLSISFLGCFDVALHVAFDVTANIAANVDMDAYAIRVRPANKHKSK